MEVGNDAGTGAGERSLLDGSAHWWWALGSGAQIMWGVRLIRRGYAGDVRLMPLKAFGVASLFVGSLATSSVALVRATGIHTVQDAIDLGANIRTNLGVTPQIPEKQITGTPFSKRRMIYHEQIELEALSDSLRDDHGDDHGTALG